MPAGRVENRLDCAAGAVGHAAQDGRVLRGDREEDVPPGALRLGDTVIVGPGERIPADGEVASNSGGVDKSILSGEPLPLAKGPGAKVVGGTVNRNGSLRFRITALGAASVLGQIVMLMREAQRSQAPI